MSDPNDPTTPDVDGESLLPLIRDAVFPMTVAKLAEASPLLSEHKIRIALERMVGAGLLLASSPDDGEEVYTIAVRPSDAPALNPPPATSADAPVSPSPDPAAVASPAPVSPAAARQALLEQLARTPGLSPEQRAFLMSEMGAADAPSSTIVYEERRLMVELSADKKAALGRQLADKTSELEEIKDVHKDRTAHFTAAKKDLETSIAELSRAIRRDDAGAEELSVRVAILPYPDQGYRDVFRLDSIDAETGKVKPVFVKREALPKPPPEQAEMFPADGGEKAPDEKVAPGVVKRKKGERKAGPFKVIDGGLAPGAYKAAKVEEVEMDALTKALSEVEYPIQVEAPGGANDTDDAPAKDDAPAASDESSGAVDDGGATDAEGSAEGNDAGDDAFAAASDDDKPDEAPPPDETPAPKGGKGSKAAKASKAKGKKK